MLGAVFAVGIWVFSGASGRERVVACLQSELACSTNKDVRNMSYEKNRTGFRMGWGRLAGACLLVVLLAMVVSGCATTPTMTAPTGAGDRTGANGEVTPRVKPGLVLNVSV
jgi:hypothetical protein